MRSSLFAIAATVAAVTAQQIGLGHECTAGDQCANGAQCYGTTSGTILTCGSFNAGCTTDDQCATNTCQNGICSGYLASSAYKIASTTSTTASAASAASTSTPATSTASESNSQLGLGQECTSSDQCAGGAQCYGTTSGTKLTCGSFNAGCTTSDQCATNTCENGICSGFLASSLYKISSTTSTATSAASSAVSTPRALISKVGLGQNCDASDQCPTGVQCYGTTSMTQKTCGSFNAACSADDQCATNTCQNGICSGFLASSLYRVVSSTVTPAVGTAVSTGFSAGSTGGVNGTGSVNATRTGSATPSASVYDGGVSRAGVEATFAVVLAAFAWAL